MFIHNIKINQNQFIIHRKTYTKISIAFSSQSLRNYQKTNLTIFVIDTLQIGMAIFYELSESWSVNIGIYIILFYDNK